MIKMESVIIGAGAIALLGGVAYFVTKGGQKSQIPQKDLEKMTLSFAKSYFVEKKSLKPETAEAVILKISKGERNQFNINIDPNYQYYVLTYFDKITKKILQKDTLIVKTKEIDMNLKDAFGDKEMLVLG